MNSISPGRASAPQDGENSVERLQAFMKTHNLSLEDLAKLLRTPPQTLEDWFTPFLCGAINGFHQTIGYG